MTPTLTTRLRELEAQLIDLRQQAPKWIVAGREAIRFGYPDVTYWRAVACELHAEAHLLEDHAAVAKANGLWCALNMLCIVLDGVVAELRDREHAATNA